MKDEGCAIGVPSAKDERVQSAEFRVHPSFPPEANTADKGGQSCKSER